MGWRRCHKVERLLLGVAVVSALLGLFGCGANSPGDVVSEFQTLVAEGELEAASRLVTSSSRQVFLMNAAVAQGLSGYFGSRTFRSIEITGERIDGDTAEVGYIVHYRDGSSTWEEWAQLEKERGKWRVVVRLW